MPGPHLLVTLSAHGFGHMAQSAPVVNALRRRLPGLRVTLRTTLPQPMLATYFDGEFDYIAAAVDFGLVMASALDVMRPESAARYRAFHHDWDDRVAAEARCLRGLAPDLVLANVAYLPLAGAGAAGIAAAALCSLHWADIYAAYFGDRPEAAGIRNQMLAAYNAARCFIQPQPAMPMPEIRHRRGVGPIARLGTDRRAMIRAALGLPPRARLILIALGGIDMRLPVEAWPEREDVYWLVPRAWGVSHRRVIAQESLPHSHIDLLCSSDALVGKPGYGAFAEAVCNGVPVLYTRRGDWPEEPYLIEWLDRHGRGVEVERGALERGEFGDRLERLWSMAIPPRPEPSGAAEAAAVLCELLG